ncbi:hypothetical protein HDU98_003193 [Podochytrium sp. JEL0797]|nr:hypothetical protein HDU98_003193 [Podochytrium sp. JEL0797]
MSSKAEKAARYQALLAKSSDGTIRLAATKSKGRHVKATSDLPAGTAVLVETASAFVLLKHAMDEICLYCCKELTCDTIADGKINLLGAATNSEGKIRCPNCIKQTYYCSHQCLQDDSVRHQLECKVVRDLPGITAAAKVDYPLMRLVLAVLVQRCLEKSDSQGDSTHSDLVFELVSHRKTCNPKWLACVQECAEDFHQHLPSELNISVSDIVSLACRINSNSHGIVDPTGNTNGEVGVGLFPLASMFNHSCEPNCSFVSSAHGKLIIRTLRPVEEGEEVCVSYVDLCTPRDDRRGKLLETKHFWCMCPRCEPSKESTLLAVDSYLDGLLCTDCKSPDAFHNSHDDFRCTHCSHQISKEQHTETSHDAEASYNNAYDLFKARYNDSAITAFHQFLDKARDVLHPGHQLFLNAYATMTSAYMRLRDFVSVAKFGRLAIEAMQLCVPPNWPELADFWFRQAEGLEILGRAVEADVISVEEACRAFDKAALLDGFEKKEVVSFVMEKSLAAFETCLGMRRVSYGKDHSRTVDVSEEVERLRNSGRIITGAAAN